MIDFSQLQDPAQLRYASVEQLTSRSSSLGMKGLRFYLIRLTILMAAVFTACSSGAVDNPGAVEESVNPTDSVVFSALNTDADPSDIPSEALKSYFRRSLSDNFVARRVAEVDGAIVFLAQGGGRACLGVKQFEMVSGNCGSVGEPSTTWISMSSSGLHETPTLFLVAMDGYDTGLIGNSRCPVLSNLLIIQNPDLSAPVTLTGKDVPDVEFAGQLGVTRDGPPDQRINNCFPEGN